MSGTLPDVLAPRLAVVFCGINPGAQAAATGHNFVGRSNRFWRAVYLAGFTPVELSAEDDQTFVNYGCGLTTAVARATRSADEISRAEIIAGAAILEAKIERYAPKTIAFLGKAAFAAITGQRQTVWGPQPGRFGGAAVWVVPNPSGLNRGFSLDQLVEAYGALRRAVAKDLPKSAGQVKRG
jgi:double-stranded uracil-DNA glycosylase